MVDWFFNYCIFRQGILFLSSLVVLFEGNLLEWGQLFFGETLWWGSISRAQFSSGANCPGGNYLGANHPGGNFSQEKLSKNPIKGSLIFFSLSLNNFLVITFYKYTYFIMHLTKSQARSEQSKYCTASSSASTPGQTSPATLSISQKS